MHVHRKWVHDNIWSSFIHNSLKHLDTANILYDSSDDKVQKSGFLWMWVMDIDWEGHKGHLWGAGKDLYLDLLGD